MPSTSIADYQVLSDLNFTLNGNSTPEEPLEKSLFFVVPDDLHISSALARRPILAFKSRPYEESSLTVIFDEEVLFQTSFAASHTHVYWEAVDLSGPLAQHPSTVEMKFQVLNGRCRFGDVVMWYQVNK